MEQHKHLEITFTCHVIIRMIISYHLMIMLLSSRSAANGTIPKPCQHVLTCTATSLQTGVLHAGTNFKSTEPLPHSSFPKTSPPGGSIELCNLRKCVLAGGPTANCKQTNKQTNRDSESLSQSHVQPKKTAFGFYATLTLCTGPLPNFSQVQQSLTPRFRLTDHH